MFTQSIKCAIALYLKYNVYALLLKYLLVKHANHHLSLQQIIVIALKITDTNHCNSYNNNEKVWNIVRITKKCDMEAWSEQMLLESGADRMDAVLLQTLNL